MNADRIREYERRAFVHTTEDGFVGIFAGFTMVCAAGIVVNPALMPFFAFPVMFFPVLINRLKKWFTYPRTGYVELPEENPRHLAWGMFTYFVMALLLMALLLLLLNQLTDPAAWRKWSPLLAAVLVGAGIQYVASRSGKLVLYLVQGISVIVGLVISCLNSGTSYRGVQIFCLLVGACFFLTGLAQFVRFARKYPMLDKGNKSHAAG